jgi:hypothetical protein
MLALIQDSSLSGGLPFFANFIGELEGLECRMAQGGKNLCTAHLVEKLSSEA